MYTSTRTNRIRSMSGSRRSREQELEKEHEWEQDVHEYTDEQDQNSDRSAQRQQWSKQRRSKINRLEETTGDHKLQIDKLQLIARTSTRFVIVHGPYEIDISSA